MEKWLRKDIKNLRKKYGLSQKTLANLTGVTTNYIYLLEKGVKTSSNTLSILFDCVEEKLNRKGGMG